MTSLLILVGLITAIGGATIGRELKRIHREDRIRKEKERQVKARIEKDDARRRELVLILDRSLREKLDELDSSYGLRTLVKAQHVAERVFYDWCNDHYDLFNICDDTTVRITGIKNGSFSFELPESIKRYLRKNK